MKQTSRSTFLILAPPPGLCEPFRGYVRAAFSCLKGLAIMAGDWIKVETVTPGKPEVHAIAEICKIEPEHALGCLVCLWIWADQQTVDGNAPSVTKALLDRYTSVSGFADAMLQVGWLQATENGFVFPNFGIHNGSSAKQRAQTYKRVQKNRAKSVTSLPSGDAENCNAPSVTKALPETEKSKRREEKKEVGGTVATKPAKEKFSPPTIADVQAYAEKLGYHGFDAVQFVAHYASQDWKKSNGLRITNWKGCVVTWKKNDSRFGRSEPSPVPAIPLGQKPPERGRIPRIDTQNGKESHE